MSNVTQPWNGEQDQTIIYTLTVKGYGHREKVANDVFSTLKRILSLNFEDRASIAEVDTAADVRCPHPECEYCERKEDPRAT